jgi:DNA-binding SARP family transcriptional activator
MQQDGDQNQPAIPAVRVFLFGEVALERLVESASREPQYQRIPPTAWQGRGPALTLLKVLLCQPRRRATKQDVVALIWSRFPLKNPGRACDAAASVLRQILRTPVGESLLVTHHQEGSTIYRLADQERLWVDADACDALIEQAIQVEGLEKKREALLLWEEAARLFERGPFLEEEKQAAWGNERRQMVEGNQRLCVHHLADQYLADQRPQQAEILLRHFLAIFPTDEDALYRLLTLLAQQGRSQEALRLVAHTERLLSREAGASLSTHTLALVEQLRRQGTS